VDVPALAGLAVAAVTMLAATGAGVWWRRRDGQVRPTSPPATATGTVLTSLGVEPGSAATLLQFSSAFCAPCRATRVTCAHVADQHEGVRHVEVDAESNLDAVRALGVWRTPTVFLLDAAGDIVSRVSGQPTRAQLADALAPLLQAAAVRP
jgi:thiol-disulfide isomerase/thioredoxin